MKPLLLLLALSLATSLWAETPAPEFPEPLLLRLPDRTSMVISAQRLTPLPPEQLNDPIRLKWQPDPIKTTVTRQGSRLMLHHEWEGGKTSQAYLIGSTIVYQGSLRYPDDIRVVPNDGTDLGAPNFRQGDYPSLVWLRATHFHHTETLNGRKAHVFARSTSSETEPLAHGGAMSEAAVQATKEKKAEAEEWAWLDARTWQPLQQKTADFLFTFTWQNTPASLPPPSAPMQAALDKISKNTAP